VIEELAAKGFSGDRLNIVMINRVRIDGSLTLHQAQEQLNHRIEVAISPVPELAYQAMKQNQPLVGQDPGGPLEQQLAHLADKLMERALLTA
jgi:MinD-like ATPase involved in chromosome partitioning or flagellar assembly